MAAPSWNDIFKKRSAAINNKQPVAKKKVNVKSSGKKKSWNAVKDSAGKNRPNVSHQRVIEVMSFNEKDDCVDCKCGMKLWSGKQHKASTLVSHLDGTVAQHKAWIERKKYSAAKKDGLWSRFKCTLEDITCSVMYYPQLWATFVCVYFIVLFRLPLHLISAFNALLCYLNVQCSGSSYCWAVNEIVMSFYNVRYAQIKSMIQHAPWYDLKFDESTSKVCAKGYLSISMTYRDRIQHIHRTDHVRLQAITSSTAAAIYEELKMFIIDDLELEPHRFVSCTGDNCSTNMGCKAGVMALLSKLFSGLIIFGCFAHKLALAVSSALLSLKYYAALEKVIRRLIKWARNGNKKAFALKQAAEAVEEKAKKITILHKIRWLARETVLKAIYSGILSVLFVLKKEYEAGVADAHYLYPILSDIHFWLYFCMVLDVLVVFGLLQRYFQTDAVYVGRATERINEIEGMLDNKLNIETRGHYTNDLIKRVKAGEFVEHGMPSDCISPTVISWLKTRYDEARPTVSNEISRRYPPETMKICDDCRVFVVQNIKKVMEDKNAFAVYGHKEIEALSEVLTKRERVICSVDALNDWDQLKNELRRELRSNPGLTDQEFYDPLMERYDILQQECEFYWVLLIYDATKCMTSHSCDNERTFWLMNDIKNVKRNKLKDKLLDALVFLAKTGWKTFAEVPWKKCVKWFIDEQLKLNKNTYDKAPQNKPTFNPINLQSKQIKQYDDMDSFNENRTKVGYNMKEDKKRKKQELVDEKSDVADGVDDVNLLDIPADGADDYIPSEWGDLFPSAGGVKRSDVSEDIVFICIHNWETRDADKGVLQCPHGLCCESCVIQLFNVKRAAVKKMLKNKESYKCFKCKLEEIQRNKEKKDRKKKEKKKKKKEKDIVVNDDDNDNKHAGDDVDNDEDKEVVSSDDDEPIVQRPKPPNKRKSSAIIENPKKSKRARK